MKELLQTVVGNLADSPPSVLKMKMDELYTPSITMSQYLELFNNFRKMAAPTQISRWCPSCTRYLWPKLHKHSCGECLCCAYIQLFDDLCEAQMGSDVLLTTKTERHWSQRIGRYCLQWMISQPIEFFFFKKKLTLWCSKQKTTWRSGSSRVHSCWVQELCLSNQNLLLLTPVHCLHKMCNGWYLKPQIYKSIGNWNSS